MLLALSIGELLLIYAIPIALMLALWLAVSFVVWALVRSPLEFDFKSDLLQKFKRKRRLRSGRKRLSYFYVARLLLGDNCIQAAFLYRISHFFATHRLRPLAETVHAFSRFLTHADIAPSANIGPGLFLYHGLGTVIGKNSRIGRGVLICQGVSIGGAVRLGDGVSVWAGAQVLKGVSIGDGSEIGANAVVMNDFPAHSVIFGVPARLAGKTVSEPTAEHASV